MWVFVVLPIRLPANNQEGRQNGDQEAFRDPQNVCATHDDTTISFLALGTVVAAAAGDYDSFDGGFADQAGFGLAAVDAVLELEESFFAVGVYIVGDGGAAEGDGLFENLFHCEVEFRQLIASDGGSAAAGAEAGAE